MEDFKYQHLEKNELQNPRKTRELNEKKRHRRHLLGVFIGLVALALLYLFFFSPVFNIKTVNIVGANKINNSKLQAVTDSYRHTKYLGILSRNNLFNFRIGELSKLVDKGYLIESIDIDRNFPSTINIVVIEKDLHIAWLTGQNCYFLGEQGTVIENCGNNTGNTLKLKDLLATEVGIGRSVLSPDKIKFLLDLNELLKNIRIDYVEVNYDGPFSIRVVTFENYDILMSFELPVVDQLNRLQAIRQSAEVQKDLPGVEYFDLRFGEKVYYR